MSNGTEIVYNKEKISHGVEELKQCQKELYEADVLFYKGIMALAAAKGIDLIINEDAAINLYMPEKIVIECREEIGRLLDEITTKVALVETLNDEPKEGSSEKIQLKQVNREIEEKVEGSTNDMQALYAPPGITGGGIGCIGENPAIYAPPGLRPETPTIQPMYGVITPTPPVVTPIEPPTMQPMYGVITPNVELPNPEFDIVKEYETIPNTGIPGVIEQNYVSKHPKLIGGLAATMGLFGIPTILSDDFDEEEEKRINES